MREFTPTEIDLCKKIAEENKRKLEHGDYMVVNEEVELFDTKWAECPNRFPDASAVYNCSDDMYHKNYFPLWQEHDCLEWLIERKVIIQIQNRNDEYAKKRNWHWAVKWKDTINSSHNHPWDANINVRTLLEGLLQVVLAVMEEK